MNGGLAWALEHDHNVAVRLAIALAPWWYLRGRWLPATDGLAAAAEHAAAGGETWCAAQFWLGALAMGSDVATSFSHFTAVRDAMAGRAPVPLLARALAFRAGAMANLGQVPEAAEKGRRALAMAHDRGDPAGEASALFWLAIAADYGGDVQGAGSWLRQAQQIDQAAIPGWIARPCTRRLALVLDEIGEAADAQRYCADGLALARQAGALYDQGQTLSIMAALDLHADRLTAATAHLREALELYAHRPPPT